MITKKQRKIQLKRGLASLLALSLAIPATGTLTAFAGGEVPFSDEWALCAACSEETPHLISTKEDLDKIRTHLDENGHVTGYFQLANDIVFEEADFAEGGAFSGGDCDPHIWQENAVGAKHLTKLFFVDI